VKRVLGLPGEQLTIDFGQVVIDGHHGLDRWGMSETFPEGSWLIPDGQIFVLSDNRGATVDDSRTFGPIAPDWAYRLRSRSPFSLSRRSSAS
jgi:type IV secretory pathway protease TraF